MNLYLDCSVDVILRRLKDVPRVSFEKSETSDDTRDNLQETKTRQNKIKLLKIFEELSDQGVLSGVWSKLTIQY